MILMHLFPQCIKCIIREKPLIPVDCCTLLIVFHDSEVFCIHSFILIDSPALNSSVATFGFSDCLFTTFSYF